MPQPDAPQLPDRIRAAYRSISPLGVDDYVHISRVAGALGSVPKSTLDDVLRQLDREPGFRLVPETDQHRLTPQDREAAVRIGSKAYHCIQIDTPDEWYAAKREARLSERRALEGTDQCTHLRRTDFRCVTCGHDLLA